MRQGRSPGPFGSVRAMLPSAMSTVKAASASAAGASGNSHAPNSPTGRACFIVVLTRRAERRKPGQRLIEIGLKPLPAVHATVIQKGLGPALCASASSGAS